MFLSVLEVLIGKLLSLVGGVSTPCFLYIKLNCFLIVASFLLTDTGVESIFSTNSCYSVSVCGSVPHCVTAKKRKHLPALKISLHDAKTFLTSRENRL